MSAATKDRSASKAAGDISFDRLSATLALDSSVQNVRLVSPARAKHLAKLGIYTIRDMLTHFPRRYIDMSNVQKVAHAPIGSMCTISGLIHDIKLKQPKPRLTLVEISLVDDSGLLMITCFRQPWLMDSLKKGMHIAVSGKIEFNYGFKRMTNPFIEEAKPGDEDDMGRIIPVHAATEKLSSAWIRRIMENALEQSRGVLDPLPLDLRIRYRLFSRQNALQCIHFPHHMEEANRARRRLVYEELLLLELHLMSESQKRSEGKTSVAHAIEGKHLALLKQHLPFALTEEQLQAVSELLDVLATPKTANHLLLGDVGTGKTIVAAFALAAVADTQTQALMMAPTEILARQYGEKLGDLFEKAGITWEVLTGSTSASDREAILAKAQAGTIDVLFGTHALLEDDVVLKNCSLVVIDEQHRFGVDQRAKLLSKGEAPDALFLTATPIPRSLALALYGDLSLSYIKSRPRNSAGNTTRVLEKADRGQAYDAALRALGAGKQVYIVCPLVGVPKKETPENTKDEYDALVADEAYEYSSVSIESEDDFERENVKAAFQEAEYLQNKTFIDYKVALLHGKMTGKEKQEVMDAFRTGEVNVLVATTVIEVGVDVANATVMIIEDADRFGLAQLHQLRGRVGRGDEPGEVYLISSTKIPLAIDRLQAMEKTQDGLELATYDLSLRKEGDILGNRQHGTSVLKLVNVVRDGKIIEAAHGDAEEILKNDPTLETDLYKPLAREMRLIFKDIGKTEAG